MTAAGKGRVSSSLSENTFEHLMAELAPDGAQAGLRYERLRGRLILFFARRSRSSPEDLADEVIDRLARRLSEAEPIASLEGYALGIARLVLKEEMAAHARETAAQYLLRNTFGRIHTLPEEADELERRIVAMERCLSLRPAEEADLLARYYLPEQKLRISARAELSRGLDLSPGALRKRVFRLCEELRRCVGERLRLQAQRKGGTAAS